MATLMKKKKSTIISGLLGVGSRFEGEIRFEGTLRIDGEVSGQIMCKNNEPSTVIITESALIEANIIADTVIISGKVTGNVKAVERLELITPGRLEGLVYTSDLSIGDGALFQGECVMIRHFSNEDKHALKLEGFYAIPQDQIVDQSRQSINTKDQVDMIEY